MNRRDVEDYARTLGDVAQEKGKPLEDRQVAMEIALVFLTPWQLFCLWIASVRLNRRLKNRVPVVRAAMLYNEGVDKSKHN